MSMIAGVQAEAGLGVLGAGQAAAGARERQGAVQQAAEGRAGGRKGGRARRRRLLRRTDPAGLQERDQMVGELAEARRSCKGAAGAGADAARPKALQHAHAHLADLDLQVALCSITTTRKGLHTTLRNN